jgi:hypothetical protein
MDKALYAPTTTPVMVEVPSLPFLMVDGIGDPVTSREYASAVQALYAISYGLKFAIKKAGGADHKVCPLEGLWWWEGGPDFSAAPRDEWSWTMMIRQPPEVASDRLDDVVAATGRKKPGLPLELLRLAAYAEGRAAQVLHRGPYAEEHPTIERLHTFITEQGYRPAGRHHEIYLTDPARTAPEKMRTVLRQPVSARNGAAAG